MLRARFQKRLRARAKAAAKAAKEAAVAAASGDGPDVIVTSTVTNNDTNVLEEPEVDVLTAVHQRVMVAGATLIQVPPRGIEPVTTR